MFDHECVGDVTALQALIPNLSSNGGNWVEGSVGKFKICAKVFQNQSDFGIKNGRISKLQVCDTSQEHWGFDACYLNYDRGWDIRPKDASERDFLNQMLEALGDDVMEDDDFVWYDLYGYKTEEDFENLYRQHLGSYSYKVDALNEAKGYLTGSESWEPYAIVKVRCSDDEADGEVILRNDKESS